MSRDFGGVDGTRGLDELDREAEADVNKRSREGVARRRGWAMLSLADCCRFSLEADARRPAVGTGSLEGRGMPDGLEPGDWSMLMVMLVIVQSKVDVVVGHAGHARKGREELGKATEELVK